MISPLACTLVSMAATFVRVHCFACFVFADFLLQLLKKKIQRKETNVSSAYLLKIVEEVNLFSSYFDIKFDGWLHDSSLSG